MDLQAEALQRDASALQFDIKSLSDQIKLKNEEQQQAERDTAQANVIRDQAYASLKLVQEELEKARSLFIQQSESNKNKLQSLEAEIISKQNILTDLSNSEFLQRNRLVSEFEPLEIRVAELKLQLVALVRASTTLSKELAKKQKQNADLEIQIAVREESLNIINQDILKSSERFEQIKLETALNIEKQGELTERETAVTADEEAQALAWSEIKIMQERLTPEYQKVFTELLKQNS